MSVSQRVSRESDKGARVLRAEERSHVSSSLRRFGNAAGARSRGEASTLENVEMFGQWLKIV